VLVWIDLANSPHVPLFAPVVDRLEKDGWDVWITVRDHAQTRALAHVQWPRAAIVGGASPSGRAGKAVTVGRRIIQLRRLLRGTRPHVALSHASYAQIVAAKAARIPAVNMMDYEYQPANHLSFRLADRLIVPDVFPESALRRFGVKPDKVKRYPGFKEELYLADFQPDQSILEKLEVDRRRVIAVMRPPPEGALYHSRPNRRFDDVLELAIARSVEVILLPRSGEQVARYRGLDNVTMPAVPVDGRSLLACADLTIGAGGTMNRESALLGTPTYTVFATKLASVDAELIRRGLLYDLRDEGTVPHFRKRTGGTRSVGSEHREHVLDLISSSLAELVEG
jgi:uncharacterized protein